MRSDLNRIAYEPAVEPVEIGSRRQVPLVLVVALQCLPAAGATAFLLVESQSLGILAALCGASILCAGLYILRRREVVSFVALFVACYVALHLLYPFSALALDLTVPQDERIGQYAFISVVGLSLFLIGHALTCRRKLTLTVPAELPRARVGRAFWLFIVPLIAAFFIVASHWGAASNLVTASRVLIKEEASGATLLAHYLWVVGSVGIVLGPLYLRGRVVGWIPFVLLVGLTAVAGFAAFRTRSALVLPAGSVLVGLWLTRQVKSASKELGRGTPKRRFELRSPAVWKLVLVGLLAIVAVSYVRIARGLFEERGVAGLAEVDISEALLYNIRRGDLGFAPVVFDAMGHVPARADYLKGQSYYRLLFAPIPRSIWPDKPPNTQRIVASWLYPGRIHQTTPPGIQGDLYINFGLGGVVGFVVFGWFFGLLDRWHGLGRAIAVGGGFVPVFHLVRGGFTNPMLLLAVLVISATVAAAVVEGRMRVALRSVRV